MDFKSFEFRQHTITTHEGLGGKDAEIFKVFSRQQQLNYGQDTHPHTTTHTPTQPPQQRNHPLTGIDRQPQKDRIMFVLFFPFQFFMISSRWLRKSFETHAGLNQHPQKNLSESRIFPSSIFVHDLREIGSKWESKPLKVNVPAMCRFELVVVSLFLIPVTCFDVVRG